MSISAFAITLEEAKETTVNLKLGDIPITIALNYISQATKIKIHYTAAKNDPLVTVDFRDVPADKVLTFIGQRANLAVSYKEDGVYFTPK